MPRRRVRVQVVAAENPGMLQAALDQALTEEQADRSWHVAEVTLAAISPPAGCTGNLAPEPFVALISLHKQEWFFTDFLKGVVDFVRGKSSSPEGNVS